MKTTSVPLSIGLTLASLLTVSTMPATAQTVSFHNKPLATALKGFMKIGKQTTPRTSSLFQTTTPQKPGNPNQLMPKGKALHDATTGQTHQRYQQYYHGIQVIGGEVVINHTTTPSRQTSTNRAYTRRLTTPKHDTASGSLVEHIQLDSNALDTLNSPKRAQDGYVILTDDFKQTHQSADWQIKPVSKRLVIAEYHQRPTPMYDVTFYAAAPNRRPHLMHALIDAKTPSKIYKKWDDIRYAALIKDRGYGGNQDTGKYPYGRDGYPPLSVTKQSLFICLLDNPAVRVVSLYNHHTVSDSLYYRHAATYVCGTPPEQHPFVGAYSPEDDAMFFGQIIINLYQDWIHTAPIGYDGNNQPKKLVLRVHFTDPYSPFQPYDNAYWDPEIEMMNFGDGNPNVDYPLISIDIAAHEVSHGFTSNHSDLNYHDQSGSLNESFSDMAGIAAKYYLYTHENLLFRKIYGSAEPNQPIFFEVGLNDFHDRNLAIRYMANPHQDGESADCYQQVKGCTINYRKVIKHSDGEQSYIVHTASGIYNKAFFLLATKKNWNIKKAFQLFARANMYHWTSGGVDQQAFYDQAACGVVAAAKELHDNTADVIDAFHQVGVLINKTCQ